MFAHKKDVIYGCSLCNATEVMIHNNITTEMKSE